MPRKYKTPAVLVMNRENQRRSRARRRAFVQDLEQRVREHERHGAQATAEMQRAARSMAVEIQALRFLLVSRGLTTGEIESYLQSAIGGFHARQHPDMWPSVSNMGPMGHPESDVTVASEALQSRRDHLTSPPFLDQPADAPLPPQHPHQDTLPANAECQCDHEPGSSPTLATCRDMTLEKSCEEAAAILAHLRGESELHEIRSELGCSGEGACVIRNTELFGIMDKLP